MSFQASDHGFEEGTCLICSSQFIAQFEYQKMGACGACVRSLAHEFAMAHSGEPAWPFSTDEQCKEYYEDRLRIAGKRKAVISKSLRKAVLERDAYRCQICGDHHDLHIDHIHPESKGGATSKENLQALCAPCNLRKGASVQ